MFLFITYYISFYTSQNKYYYGPKKIDKNIFQKRILKRFYFLKIDLNHYQNKIKKEGLFLQNFYYFQFYRRFLNFGYGLLFFILAYRSHFLS